MFDPILSEKIIRNKKSCESFIKQLISKRLLSRLDFIKRDPQDIYIVGYNDRETVALVQSRFPASIVYTNKPAKPVSLIISNTCAHLEKDLMRTLDTYASQLKANGELLLSSFGEKNLSNFSRSLLMSDYLPHINTMITLKDWGELIQKSTFTVPVIENEPLELSYKTINGLFDDLRLMGEPLSDTKMRKTLTGKNRWRKIKQSLLNNLALDLDIIYLYAKHPGGLLQSLGKNTEVFISLSELRKQLK